MSTHSITTMTRCILTAFVVVALSGTATSDAALIDWWRFEEGIGGTTADSGTDGSHTATLQNGASWVTTSLAPVPSGTTAAIEFDGDNDRLVALGYKAPLVGGTNSRTIAAWVKSRNVGAPFDMSILAYGRNAAGQKWNFRTQDDNGSVDGNVRIEVNGGYRTGSTIITDNQWHHVAMTWSNDGTPNVEDVQIYVDGVLEGSYDAVNTQSINTNTASGIDVNIGDDHSSRGWNGWIDDVRIYDEVLGAGSIRAIAVTNRWDGGGTNNNWGNDNNWDTNTEPLNGSNLVFEGALRKTNSHNIGGLTNVNSITFDTGDGWSIGGNDLRIRAGGITANVDATIRAGMTITLDESQTWTIAAGKTLTKDDEIAIGTNETLTIVNGNPAGAVATLAGSGSSSNFYTNLQGNNATLVLGDNVLSSKAVSMGNNGAAKFIRVLAGDSAELSGQWRLRDTNSNDTDMRAEAGAGGTLEISGHILNSNGSRAVRFGGGGTVILSRATGNTYGSAGTTRVGDSSTLLATNTSGSATGNGNLIVLGGSTIGGTGLIGQLTTINDNAMLSPGLSAGQLTFENLTLNNLDGDGDLLFELGSSATPGITYDQTIVTDTLTLGSTLDLDDFTFTLLPGFDAGMYTLFDVGTLNGTVDTATEITLAPQRFGRLSQVGNDVVLVVTAAAPEPSTFVLVTMGLVGLGLCRRRRGRSNVITGSAATAAVAAILFFSTNSAQAVTVTLNDPSFENAGAAATGTPDNVNFRNWQHTNNNLGTYNAGGAGAGNNEGVWLIRGFAGDDPNGDLEQNAIPGKTGNQYFAYAVPSQSAQRGLFQHVGMGGTEFLGPFELKVDVFSPTTATNEFVMRVVGFDDPSEVLVDIGGATSITQVGGGTGGFEVISAPWTATDASGAFVEKTLSGSFTGGPYNYIGVLMGSRLTGGGASDRVGFDNVRLTAEIATAPEPSTFVLVAMGLVGLGLCRRRRGRSALRLNRGAASIAAILGLAMAIPAQAEIVIFDDFNDNDPGGGTPAVGGPDAINGGFQKETNTAGGSGALNETVLDDNIRIRANGPGNNDNTGIVSISSFDPTQTNAFTVTWEVTSFQNPQANGMNLVLQDNQAFFGSARPTLQFQFDRVNDNTFHLVAHDGGTSVDLISDPITLGEALDGFTLTATLSQTGWSFTSTGIASLADASGSWTATHNYNTLFDSTTFVGAFIQRSNTNRDLFIDSITVDLARLPEPSTLLLTLLGVIGMCFGRGRQRQR